MVFPAHAWTPWFSIFGAFSGFDSIEDCYQDMTKHIHALETGLSSDPAMNWRLSKLDRYTFFRTVTATVFGHGASAEKQTCLNLKNSATKKSLATQIIANDSSRFKFTIETDPAYGKYHWTGHRNCKVSFSPAEAIKFGNICPVCHRTAHQRR